MEHPIEPARVGSLEELGTHIAQMRYDAMLVVLRAFKTELARQQCADAQKERHTLSRYSTYACSATEDLLRVIGAMWHISIPHMERDLATRPPVVDTNHLPHNAQ